MTVTVNCYTSGDVWVRQEEMIQTLYSIAPTTDVIIDTQFEGISLGASGILDAINQWVAETGRDPRTIQIGTPNQFEKIPYQFKDIEGKLSYSFGKHVSYLCDPRLLGSSGKLFGLFMQRYTKDRETIAQDMLDYYQHYCLISIQRNNRLAGNNQIWWPAHIYNIGSIDNTDLQDHYGDNPTANSSLLTFYDQFQIEIVAETITRGESFFATEKTVRPIVGCRPFLLYGTVGFLKNLKQAGFRTFSELWSEDYDQFEGPERWNQIKLTIDLIVRDGYNIDLAREIVAYNYHYLSKCTEKKA